MKTKITLLVLTALLGLTNVFANSMPTSENVVENEMMTTNDNSVIISAGKRIYALDMNTYHATLLATSPYVNEINSIASDQATGWVLYVSNHISSYNWTIYGYNVYTNTHKNFGSVRHFFTGTGHAYSSRGLASGGGTFYNGKLYFAMEYPVYCYYYRDGRRTSGNSNPKDELSDNQRAAGTVSTGMFTTRGTSTPVAMATEEDNGGRDGNGENPEDFAIIEAEEANELNDNVNDYIPEVELPEYPNATGNDGELQQRGTNSTAQTYSDGYTQSYSHSTYNNYMYLLEICFNGLSDASGQTTSVANGRPVYDNWWYSSFLYRGELGDIVVGDNGQMYAATSYQVQAYNFNSNRYDWANNEDVYAQMAKDKHSNLQLLKNKRTYTTYYYHGCPQNVYQTKSFVQKYTAPSSLRTFNSIQLGSLNEISGLNSEDVGRITDASDYINLTPPVSYKIEGFVFDDNNENGSFNSGQGETQTSGITVTLYADNNNDNVLDSGDTVIDSQVTGSNGSYIFNNVEVAETLVSVTVPNNTPTTTYTSTTPEVVDVTGSTNDVHVNFGINEALIPVNYDVFGTVYDDNNEDAILDNGEAGLANVTLTLYADNNADGALDSGDTVITTTTSGNDGSYSFLHVCIQNTIVAVTVPTNTGDFTYTLTTSGTQAIDAINTDVTGVDFGINEQQVVNFNVSGNVFDDDNANGAADAGEVALEGVLITLYADNNADGALDAGDTVISTTNSVANGNYNFANVTVENVVLAITIPTDTADFTYTLTTAATLAASSTTTDVTGLDFGIDKLQIIDYNISGTVFNDINTNGTNDTEAGLDAITVKLYSDNDASGTLTAGDGLLQIGSTGVNGTYSFTNVTTEYTLVGVEVPGNTPAFTYTATTPVKVGVSSTITDVNDVDFGIFKDEVIDFNISGTVFEDEDSNGIIDTTELGRFDNVTMMLYRDNNEDGAFDTGDTMITSTTTGVDGTYSFSNVTDKNTLVMSSTPANTPEFIYTSTTPELVAVMSTIADVNDVDYGVNITTIIDYNISGTVFDDDNNSGDINPSEGRIQNVVVRLYEDMNEDGLLDANDNQIANRATGPNGEYQFNNVTTRKTLVEFRIPGNTPNFTYTATTPDVVAVEGTTTDITNVNFGINEEQVIDYNISGTVFDDNNENGTIDAGDGVLDGINITLYADNNADGVLDVADTTLTSTSTDVNGAYSFSNITTENVLAIVTVPGNTATFTYVLTTSNTQAVSSLITDVNGLDFGINENLVIDYNISGTVFDDDNANGAEDAGEPALENVTLSLYADNNADGTVDAGDTVITTTTSATDGTYSFLNVTVQNTVVEVTVPTNNGTFTYVLTTSGSVNTSSTINDVNNVDFGINREEVILYDISGTVFDDDDSSGVQDAGEGFVAGVTVTLYADNDGNGILDATDTVITTTTSDATAGDYIFTGVTERNTIVEVTVPTSTGAFTYTLTTAATQSVSSTITNVIDVDFGIDEFEIINYSIFGTVYDDDNENAALDATEAGRLENITLTLYVDEDGDGRLGDDDTIIQTTTTAADGTYSFLNITIRNTVTAITVPENTAEYTYTLTTAARLTNSSVSTDIFNVDFGVNKVATSYVVSGNVFNDENADGTNATTEAGLRGVTVNLFDDVNGNGRIDRGEPLIDTASSDRSGNYQFLGITAPNVIVQVVVPASTSQFMYNPTTPVIVVLSGGVSTTVDFGIQRIIVILYNVSGIVWDDQNSDQIIDGNEGRLSGIGVTLFNDANANGILDAGDNAVSTIPTSTNGDYLFTNVTFRNIIIAPAAPADGVFTTPSNRAVSSVNTDVVDVNFGVRVPSTLFQVTGVVFDDQNENGIADPGEASLNGLPVEIYADTDGDGFFDPNLDALVAFTQTSNGGFGFLDPNYLVDDIPPGLVHIVLTLPDDTIFETYRNTYDPDSGTASPDGVYTVNMNNDLFNIDFGVKRTDATSTSRADSGDVLFTNGNAINAAPEDVSERLRLYPNPTVNQIAINASEFAGDVTVEIYNDRGYRLMSTTVSAFGSEYKVDVQRLAPGMYYAKFASNNKVASKKFVKK